MFLVGVDDPHRARQFNHVADPTQGAGEFDALTIQDEEFLLRLARGGRIGLKPLEILKALEPLVHRREVGEHAAEPALIDVGHAHACRLLRYGLLGLLLRADKHDASATRDSLLDEFVGAVDVGQRLLQINNVDPVALSEDEALHLGIPASRLVAEVDTALEQLAHRDDGHGVLLQSVSEAHQSVDNTRRSTSVPGDPLAIPASRDRRPSPWGGSRDVFGQARTNSEVYGVRERDLSTGPHHSWRGTLTAPTLA